MKFMFLILLSLGMPVFPASAQLLKPQPKIACDKPKFEWGEADNTTKITHTFFIRNNGTGRLLISDVKKSCGCTEAEISSKNLAPGEEASLKVVLDLKNRRGKQAKNVKLYSNDPDQPVFQVDMNGIATSQIVVTPRVISLGNFASSEGATAEVILAGRPGVDFKITKIQSLRNIVKPAFEKVEGQAGGAAYKVSASVGPGQAENLQMYDQIRVFTDHVTLPFIDVQVSGFVVGKIRVVPEKLYFTKRKTAITRYLNVMPGTVKEFKVLKVEWPTPDVEVKIAPVGGNYRIVIKNVVADERLSGKELILHTDVEGFERIVVPILLR